MGIDIIGVPCISQICVVPLGNDECFLILVATEGIAVFRDIVECVTCPSRAYEVRVGWQKVLSIVLVSFVADDAQIVTVDYIPNRIAVCGFQQIPSYLVVSIDT